ncbi:MAG: hypothetical protein ACTSQI_10170 [Candidatus Helarchaeota archaeon]
MEKKIMALRMLLGGLHYCASELMELDPAFKEKFSGIDVVMQWKSEPDGPRTYTIIKDTVIEFNDDGVHENPTYTLICRDLDVALDIFKGRNPIIQAIEKGDVEVDGDKELAIQNSFYLMALIPLLGALTGAE